MNNTPEFKLSMRMKYKLDKIHLHFTDTQKEEMQENLEKITQTMADAYGYEPNTVEYLRYAHQIRIKYIGHLYNKLIEDIRGRRDRNKVPFKKIIPRDLF